MSSSIQQHRRYLQVCRYDLWPIKARHPCGSALGPACYLERQVVQHNGPLDSKVAHHVDKVAPNYRPLSSQVMDIEAGRTSSSLGSLLVAFEQVVRKSETNPQADPGRDLSLG